MKFGKFLLLAICVLLVVSPTDAKVLKRRKHTTKTYADPPAEKTFEQGTESIPDDQLKRVEQEISKEDEFKGEEWEAKTADEKVQALWAKVTEVPESAPWLGAMGKLGALLGEKMVVSFNHDIGDQLPEGRKKFIHGVGVIAKVTWTPVENQGGYTGMFAETSQCLLRFSTAKAADYTKPAAGNFLPGIAIKCLRDKVHSSNIIAMKSLVGQDKWNPFAYPFSNHVPKPDNFGIVIGGKVFATVTPWVFTLGLKDVSAYKKDGTAETEPVYPFRLWFEAPEATKALFPDDDDNAYAAELGTVLGGKLVGKPMYSVYAQASPDAPSVLIGTITVDEDFTPTAFGDLNLFFAHNLMDFDLEGHEDWADSMPKYDGFFTETGHLIGRGILNVFDEIKNTVSSGLIGLQESISHRFSSDDSGESTEDKMMRFQEKLETEVKSKVKCPFRHN